LATQNKHLRALLWNEHRSGPEQAGTPQYAGKPGKGSETFIKERDHRTQGHRARTWGALSARAQKKRDKRGHVSQSGKNQFTTRTE
jgi:hypothetical protein